MTNQGKTGIDRRSALKKAAVGGAIAWAAPTILSSRASAVAPPCTPKCCPQTVGSFPITAFEACPTGTPGQKAFYVQATNPGTVFACPCGGDPTNVAVSTDPSSWTRTGNPINPDGTCNDGSFLNPLHWSITTGLVDDVESIIFDTNGAIPQGCFKGDFTVTADCIDRTGDICRRTCTFTANFSYIPNDGSCVDAGTIGQGTAFLQSCSDECVV